jgi:hypothetical protein
MLSHMRGRPNSPEAYMSMIRLHGQTQGRSTRVLSRLLSSHRPYLPRQAESAIFGTVPSRLASSIVKEVRDTGFAMLPMKLPQPIIDRLVAFARSNEANFKGGDIEGRGLFDSVNPKARIYSFPAKDCLHSPDVQDILGDEFLLSLAGRYLGVTPIVDILTMWWSAVFEEGSASEAAQLFHFDMDKPRWLKLFVYLTDVDESAGPHVYVERSHRLRSDKIGRLLRRGYTRIPDNDIVDAYGKESLRSIVGTAGTIFVADTIGFHKGLPPAGKERLVLQLSYATTLFGGVSTSVTMPPSVTPTLAAAMKRRPTTYALFKK